MRKYNELPDIQKKMIRTLVTMGFNSGEIATAFKVPKTSVVTVRGNMSRSWKR